MTFGISDGRQTREAIDKYPILGEFCKHFHGSGVNYDWHIEETDREVRLYNSYDCLNEVGSEVATQSFVIVMPKDDITEFKVQCQDKNRYWWDRNTVKQYIEDTATMWLASLLQRWRENVPVLSGFTRHTTYGLSPSTPEKREAARKQVEQQRRER